MLRYGSIAILILYLIAGQAYAGPFEDGLAAYDRKDYATALRYWRPLADNGDAGAQFNIGVMYSRGDGVAQDDAEAAKWVRKAAEQGLPMAQFELGISHENGQGVLQDHSESMKWLRRAAENGYAPAQSLLGLTYSLGDGFRNKPDYTEAKKWFQMAAEQGDVEAQRALGDLYMHFLSDKAEAIKWYHIAAENGSTRTPEALGKLYGSAEFQDPVRAYMWFQIAEATDKSRNFHLQNLKNSVGKGMTPDQIAEAQRLAQEWMNKHQQ